MQSIIIIIIALINCIVSFTISLNETSTDVAYGRNLTMMPEHETWFSEWGDETQHSEDYERAEVEVRPSSTSTTTTSTTSTTTSTTSTTTSTTTTTTTTTTSTTTTTTAMSTTTTTQEPEPINITEPVETTTEPTTVATTTVSTTMRTLSEEEKLEAELAKIEADSARVKLLHTEQRRRQDELRRQSQSDSDGDGDERVLSIDVPMLAMRELLKQADAEERKTQSYQNYKNCVKQYQRHQKLSRRCQKILSKKQIFNSRRRSPRNHHGAAGANSGSRRRNRRGHRFHGQRY